MRVEGEGVGDSELDPGMAGSGGTTVWSLTAPLVNTRAISSATTSSTAPPAATHNQRGDLGPSGGGGAIPSGGRPPPGGGWSCCCQYAGNRVVGFVSFSPGAHCGA